MFEMGQKVYFICDFVVLECTIQGILKQDSTYQDAPEYVYFLEDTKMSSFRNVDNEYFEKISQDEIYVTKDEAIKVCNRLRETKISELKEEIEALNENIN